MTFQSTVSFDESKQEIIGGLRTDLEALRLEVDRLRGAVAALKTPERGVEGGAISDAVDAAVDVATRARATIQERLSHADEDVHEYVADIRKYVRENPLTAALMFTVCGYVVGRFK